MKFIKTWLANRQRKKQLAKAPKTLLQATVELDKHMTDDSRKRFAKEDGTSPGSNFHFGGGMAMRNNWGLWDTKQPLTKFFRDYGVWHPDDMSAIIFKAYWCFLNEVDFDMEKEAEFYKNFWKNQGSGFDGVELSS